MKAWCRERRLSSHQLTQWQAELYQLGGAALNREEAQGLRILKAENQCIEHALQRKEKALAETAALLVSQKNYRALLRGKT
ncbi:MAG TPA: hypothetical protein VIF10_06795 [Methylobacter sp.]